jgi:hypothetical protein
MEPEPSTVDEYDIVIADRPRRRRLVDFGLYDLRTKRNALTLFCRLPIDILVHIIQDLQDLCRVEKPYYGKNWNLKSWYPPDLAQWIQISLVCVRLRQLVLETPVLWRTCYLDQGRSYLTCGPRKLDAHGESFLGSDYERTLDVVRSHISRLSIAIDTKASYAKNLGRRLKAAHRALTHGMRSLQDLEIMGCLEALEIRHLVDDKVGSRLASLKVAGVPLPDQLFLPQLRILEWQSILRRGDHSRLAKVISSAPSLEHVCLVEISVGKEDFRSSSSWSSSTANLGSLRTLIVTGSVDIVYVALRVFPNPLNHLAINIRSKQLERSHPSSDFILARIQAFITLAGRSSLSAQITQDELPCLPRIMITAQSSCASLELSVLTELSDVLHAMNYLQVETISFCPKAARACIADREWLAADLFYLKRIVFISPETMLPDKEWRSHFICWIRRRGQVGLRLQAIVAIGLFRKSKNIVEILDSGLVDELITTPTYPKEGASCRIELLQLRTWPLSFASHFCVHGNLTM